MAVTSPKRKRGAGSMEGQAMRCSVSTRLVLLALLAPVAVHNAAYAGKDNKQQPTASTIVFSKEIEGKSRVSQQEAIDSALAEAAEAVSEFLKEQKPSLAWKQDAAYLRDHLLGDVTAASSKEWERGQLVNHTILIKKAEFNVAGEPFSYQARLQVTVKSDDIERLVKAEKDRREAMRPEVVRQRQMWLGKFLLGAVALLTIISGYIRLEDATKGYYTAWLRLGVVGILCAVGAGLWLTR
jgi:hypothetical protein